MNPEISIVNPIKLQQNWYIKIHTNFFLPLQFMTGEIVEQTVGQPLRDWLDQSLIGDYNLNMHFNTGDPYYNLLLVEEADVVTVMMRYGNQV
jgi:hypothetical protein